MGFSWCAEALGLGLVNTLNPLFYSFGGGRSRFRNALYLGFRQDALTGDRQHSRCFGALF